MTTIDKYARRRPYSYLRHVDQDSILKQFKYYLVAMAFWFGITSMIRPTGLERIPSSFVLASMKQGLSVASTQSHTQQMQRTPQPYSYFTPSFGGADAMYSITPREQYLFSRRSEHRGGSLVSRVIERERSSSTYCITGTDYEWMPASACGPGHKWKRS
jgi:hypothetical protein